MTMIGRLREDTIPRVRDIYDAIYEDALGDGKTFLALLKNIDHLVRYFDPHNAECPMMMGVEFSERLPESVYHHSLLSS
jgi:hypothetical protein